VAEGEPFGRHRRPVDPKAEALPGDSVGLALPLVPDGRPMSLTSFTVSAGRIVAIDIIADPAGLHRLRPGATAGRG
jgi:hypothetical protein